MAHRLHGITRALLLTVLTGCGAEAGRSTPGVAERDSAGVTIVDHSAAHMAALPSWTLGEPIERIAGEADTGFTEIAAAVRRSDGRYVIHDRRRRDLRIYSAAGEPSQVVARPGRGPGELEFLTALQLLRGDSLGYSDPNQRRYSLIDPSGRFLSQARFPQLPNGSVVRLVTRFDDGRFAGPLRSPFNPDSIPKDRVFRERFFIVAAAVGADSGTAALDTLAAFPDGEAYFATTTENGETRPDEYPIRFGRRTVVAYHRLGFVAASNDAAEWRAFDTRGLRRIVRYVDTTRAVTAQDRDALLAEVDAGMIKARMPAALREEWRRNAATWRFAERFAPVDRLLYGTDGSVWVEQPSVTVDEPHHYWIFDPRGRAVARLVLPARVTALQVSLTEVVGTAPDEDDVPAVFRWPVQVAR